MSGAYGAYDPSKIPLAFPPQGAKQNLVDPYNRSWQVFLTSALCLAVTTVFVGLRLYSKFFVIKQSSPDDYATIAAYFAVIIYTSLTISFNSHGYGIHIWNLTLTDLTDHQSLILLVNNSLYGPVLFAVKLSIFMLIYSIFGRLRWMRYLVFLGILVTGLFYMINVIVFPSLCAPRSGQTYLEAAGSARCQRSVKFGVFSASFNIFTDFYMLFLPIPAVLGLQMPTKKKVGVLAIFGTGLLACITSCLALWTRVQLNRSIDKTWMVTPTNVTALIEMNVGLWVGSMPALAGIVRRQKIGFASWMDVIRSRFSSIASLLSLRGAKTGNSDSSHKASATSSTSDKPLGQGPKRYVELRDYQRTMHGPWDETSRP